MGVFVITIARGKKRTRKKSPEISRLLQFMSANKLETADLAASIDMPERTLLNYIWGDKPLVGHLLRKLLAVHNVSVNWLVAGVGEMYADNVQIKEPANNYDVSQNDYDQDERIKPLIRYLETTDLNNLSDYWWLIARSIEQSLIQSGAIPGKDYSFKDCYELARPFVLEKFKTENIDITAAKNF